MKALCSEAAIISLRRAYPQVYSSNVRLEVDAASLVLTRGDFAAAFSKVIPASRRSSGTSARALEGLAAPLLVKHVDNAFARAREVFAPADKDLTSSQQGESGDASSGGLGGGLLRTGADEEWIAALTDVQEQSSLMLSAGEGSDASRNAAHKSCSNLWDPSSITSRPRVMLRGARGMSHADVAAALLQKLESYQTFNIDISSLLADGSYVSAEQALVSRIVEARRAAPCVVYLPDILGWWRAASDSLRTVLASQLDSIPVNLPVLWVSSLILDIGDSGKSSAGHEDSMLDGSEQNLIDCGNDTSGVIIDDKLRQVVLFLSGSEDGSKTFEDPGNRSIDVFTKPYASVVDLTAPTRQERMNFFGQFFESLSTLPKTLYQARKSMYTSQNQVLKIAADVSTSVEGDGDVAGKEGLRSATVALADVNEDRDQNFMREQRVFFRAALSELLKEKRFQSLWRPVDPEQVVKYIVQLTLFLTSYVVTNLTLILPSLPLSIS
jgi:SpoVK/Ycf46/Vps4 family AAA+-type ATPase